MISIKIWSSRFLLLLHHFVLTLFSSNKSCHITPIVSGQPVNAWLHWEKVNNLLLLLRDGSLFGQTWFLLSTSAFFTFLLQLSQGGKRSDGRSPEGIRPITSTCGLLPRAHGSALFTRGETQVCRSVVLLLIKYLNVHLSSFFYYMHACLWENTRSDLHKPIWPPLQLIWFFLNSG